MGDRNGEKLRPPDPGREILHQGASESGGFAVVDCEVAGPVGIDDDAGVEEEQRAAGYRPK